jgi:hypothetical protein
MLKIRYIFIVLGTLLSIQACIAPPVRVEVEHSRANSNIDIELQAYPQFEVIRGYPAYYASQLDANLFFYDGMYWVYQNDNWYSSSWYNGPWWIVRPELMPVGVLQIPLRYYRQQPAFSRGWRQDAPPHWGEHWGRDWEQSRNDWGRRERESTPELAPLPVYQRQYSRERYPQQGEQQHELHQKNYQPRDPLVRQLYQEQVKRQGSTQQRNFNQEKQDEHEERGYRQ